MKHIKLLLLFIIVTFSCNTKNDEIIIAGHVKDSTVTVAKLHLQDTIISNNLTKGNFKFVISPKYEGYMNLELSENIELFANEGDSLYLDVKDKGLIFLSGVGHEEFLYLLEKKFYAKQMGIDDPRTIDADTYSSDLETFNAKIDSIRHVQTELMGQFIKDYSNMNKFFIEKEQKRIQYFWMKQKFSYPEIYEMLTHNEVKLPEDYYSFAENIDFNDSVLLPFDEYQSCLKGLLEWKTKDLSEKNLSLRLNAKYTLCKELTNSKKIVETICFQLLRHHIVFNGIEGIDSSFNDYLNLTYNVDYANELNRQYKAWEHLKSGKKAPEFVLADVTGKKVKLSDFLGKTVYIDCWSTKCGKCISEMPTMKKLVDEMRSYKNMVFITIASDSDINKWRSKLKEFEINSINLCTGENYGKFNIDYNAKAMPRYILIDKHGKLVDIIAKKPSEISEKLKKISEI